MKPKPNASSSIPELDPEMLAIVEAFATAIIRIKGQDDDVRRKAEESTLTEKKRDAESATSYPSPPNLLTPTQSSGPKLWRIAEVAEYLSISRGTIYRKVNDGTFPAPRKLGRSVRWWSSDIEDWVGQLPNGNP